MIEISLKKLASVIGVGVKVADVLVSGVTIDSRFVRSGDCFVAIQGENFDGHDFVRSAFEKGAVCAITQRSVSVWPSSDKPVLRVSDTVRALGQIASYVRRTGNYKVIAVTGSAGKTSTRKILYHVLSRHYASHQSPKNYNNKIGLPLSILSSDPDDEIIIAELGTNAPGEIGYLSEIAKPDIAIVTNVQAAHLEGLGSVEAIAEEKISIADYLQPGGELIINADCPELVRAARGRGLAYTGVGFSGNAEIRAENVGYCSDGTSFELNSRVIKTPLHGAGNLSNTLAVFAVCRLLGITLKDFSDSVRRIEPIEMRGEVVQLGRLTVINDCYNANPGSMENALGILRSLNPAHDRRRVFICGDMGELGDDGEKFHRVLGRQIAESRIDLLITTGPLCAISGRVAREVSEGFTRCEIFPDTESACNKLEKFIKESDIVLVKGSRIGRLEKAVRELRRIF